MKTKLTTILSALFVCSSVMAQNNTDVYDYFNGKIDEAVSAASVVEGEDNEDANPVYAKLFASPVLYQSVVKGACAGKEAKGDSDVKAMDDEREAVIDNMLVGLYRTAPAMVHMTEAELRSEKSVPAKEIAVSAPALDFGKLVIPDDVVGGMKTTVTKPNYWKFSGRTSLTFTQSFISDNWYQGGEKNYYAMLATLDLDMNYDDKDRLSWTNHFDFDLGFATYENGEKLGVRTNTDKLRLESTLGYKLVKSLDIAAKVKAETQSLPFYSSEDVLASAFASPLDANASLGLNYKPNLGNFKMEIYLAPFSGYNCRYVYHDELTAMYGIETGHFKQSFGTQLVVTVPTYKLTSFLDVYSRLEYYTNYKGGVDRVQLFQWETKFNVALSKYFTASLMMNVRYDEAVAVIPIWGKWHLKELFTLGVAYAW